jgi:hypothetical protein
VLPLQPFVWRRLTPSARLDYCLDETGALLVRIADGGAEEPTLTRAALLRLGFTSTQAANGNGWMVHSLGAPSVMQNVTTRWGDLAASSERVLGVDERVTLATIGAGVGDVAPDADNEVKAPRTRPGYPHRTGDTDPGDAARDREDWAASGGAHSVHGLMQTTLAQAVAARPDVFEKVSPDHYAAVLANPVASITCGATVFSQMSTEARADPLDAYTLYLLGGSPVVVDPTAAWGVKLDDELALVRFVAMWNDGARLRAGEHLAEQSARAATAMTTPARAATDTMPRWGWALVGVAGTVAVGGVAWWLYQLAKSAKPAHGKPEDDEERFVADDDAEEEDDYDEEELAEGPFLLPAGDATE